MNTDNNNKPFEAHEETTQSHTPDAEKKTEFTEHINYKEQFLRLNADLQNYKRRVEKERAEWMHVAQASALEPMLSIADDLDRAIENSEKNPDVAQSAWFEGFKLIQKNLHKSLNDLGVQEIAATGSFNPELHEALIQVESPDHQSGHIVQLLNKGYTLKSKVLRHAKVSVAK